MENVITDFFRVVFWVTGERTRAMQSPKNCNNNLHRNDLESFKIRFTFEIIIFPQNSNNMKKFIFLVLVLMAVLSAFSQIAGVSNDKLVAVNPAVIAPRTVEFEPGFGYIWSKNTFDNSGDRIPLSPNNDSIQVLQALAFRITYGFAKNFEIGTVITSSLDAFTLGLKYTILNKDKFSMGAFLGTNFYNNSDLAVRNTGIFGQAFSVVGGLTFMNKFGENKRLSLDYDVQYQNTIDKNNFYTTDIYTAIDLGYEFVKKVQLITGLNYQFHHFTNENPDSWRLTWNTGVTIHPGKMFNLIANVPIDLAGKNTGRFAGFQIILTITLD